MQSNQNNKTEAPFVEIVYAKPNQIITLIYALNPPETIESALENSGFLKEYPLDWQDHAVGIYGKILSLSAPIKAGDRIEIYRPLMNDPKTIRRQRVKK